MTLSKEKLESLIARSRDIVIATDAKGRVIYYNDGAKRSLGYAPGEILGQYVGQLYPDFEEAKKVMTDEVNNSDGSSSTLAKNLVEKGVVDSLDSVAVLEMEVEIVVTEVESEGGFFSKVRNILILVGAALVLLLGMCIGCYCRKGKKPMSPKVSNSNKQSK